MGAVAPALSSKAEQTLGARVGAPEEGNASRIVLIPVLGMELGCSPPHMPLSRQKSSSGNTWGGL